MSEYTSSYNWEKTWLNSSPLHRTNDDRRILEPHLHQRRHFKEHDAFQFWYPNTKDREEDPFFIIHGKKHSELAYPNILYMRSKSAPRDRTVVAPTKILSHYPPRPNSDVNAVKKQVHHHSKNHQSKSRSKEKRPIERWPELRVDIPSESPQYKASRLVENQNTNLNDRINKQLEISQANSKNKISPVDIAHKRQETESKLHNRPKRPLSDVSPKDIPRELINAEARTQSDIHRRIVKSEYQASYQNFSEYSKRIVRMQNEKAKHNQQQVEGCHFDRKNFNQLASSNVNLWDPLTASRSGIVRVYPTLLTKHLKDSKIPTSKRHLRFRNDISPVGLSNFSKFREKLTTQSTKYEPSKYVQKRWSEDGEPRIKVLPLEHSNDVFVCTPKSHQCNKGVNFLISRTRPEAQLSQLSGRHFAVSTSPAYFPPLQSSSGVSLAEYTLRRALSRRNRLLVSACRN